MQQQTVDSPCCSRRVIRAADCQVRVQECWKLLGCSWPSWSYHVATDESSTHHRVSLINVFVETMCKHNQGERPPNTKAVATKDLVWVQAVSQWCQMLLYMSGQDARVAWPNVGTFRKSGCCSAKSTNNSSYSDWLIPSDRTQLVTWW